WERRARELGLEKLAAGSGETVLEIGFGPGHSLVALARAVGSSGRIFGIDLSPKMSDLARHRVREAGLAQRVDFRSGDATQLPFAIGSCDAVFMSFVLELFDSPEIPQVLGECRRVLRAGGRICVVSLSMEGKPSRMRGLYIWGHERWPALLDCRPIFVGRALQAAGFQLGNNAMASLWGLPVEVALAVKPL
ncbi:MAG: class I SAM-dependent methyltransferase, partial [Rudaea sp.]